MLVSEIDYPLLKGQLVVVQDEDCSPNNHKAIAQFSRMEPNGAVTVVYRTGTARQFFPQDVYVLPLGWNCAGEARLWQLPIPTASQRKRAIRNSVTGLLNCTATIIQLLGPKPPRSLSPE